MPSTLNESELPSWFAYPHQYLRLVEQGVVNLTPWHIIGGSEALSRLSGLQNRYPGRDLVPFAVRQDNDLVACWEKSAPERVFVIKDFASEGWESISDYNSFWDWFRRACEDMIDFG